MEQEQAINIGDIFQELFTMYRKKLKRINYSVGVLVLLALLLGLSFLYNSI